MMGGDGERDEVSILNLPLYIIGFTSHGRYESTTSTDARRQHGCTLPMDIFSLVSQ
jgi:hypothetical protein